MRFLITCDDKKQVDQTLRTLSDMVLAGLVKDVQVKDLRNPDLENVEGTITEGKVELQAEFRKRLKVLGE